MARLSDPITVLRGLGRETANKFREIGISTLEHLLFHLPFRYQDKTRITPLAKAKIGEEALFEARVDFAEAVYRPRRQLRCHLFDKSDNYLLLRFFHFTHHQREAFIQGATVQCFGELKIGNGGFEMHHPEYRLTDCQKPLLEKNLSPVYSTFSGVRPMQIKIWVEVAFEALRENGIDDFFKNDADIFKNDEQLPDLKDALNILHHPQKNDDLDEIEKFRHRAQKRLIVEELASHQLSLLRLKKQKKAKSAHGFKAQNTLLENFHQTLDFELTGAQKNAVAEILRDLEKPRPMLRLLQGDVGSGKTIVAVFAAIRVVENHFQVAMMAPTEILAEQHWHNFRDYLTDLGVRVAFLVGKQSKSLRAKELAAVASGAAEVVIGTHALFQEAVAFKKLGLVIIDEQHRFGVHQRFSLAQKAQKTPHQLVMTATPIPRSLMMSAYADLDISIIDELPPGRSVVQTIAIPNTRKNEVVAKVRHVAKAGGQIYWVCTLVEESAVLRSESAEKIHRELCRELSELSVALIHGQMKKSEKSSIMQNFARGDIQVLVATTVIEVGVDVSGALMIVIENAERLGLAQLHQLRGRVGRGTRASLCVLTYQPPLSPNAYERLNMLRQSNDGFEIANKDLTLRGPGEILGTQQTGALRFKIADIIRDAYLLKPARFFAERMMMHPEAEQRAFLARWTKLEKSRYADV